LALVTKLVGFVQLALVTKLVAFVQLALVTKLQLVGSSWHYYLN